MAQFFTRPWDSQPQEACGVDLENPLSRGLLTAWTPVAGDALRLGAYPTSVVTRRAGPGGIALGQSFSGGGSVTLPALGALLSNQLTVAFVLRTDGTANNGFGDTGTSPDAEHYPYSGVLYLSGGTSTRQAYTPTGVDLTRPHCTVISSNATTASQRATIDGGLIGTASISAIGWAASPQLFVSTAFGGFGGEFYGFFAWNRALSDAEAREVSLNPWQLFEPRRVYIPTAAGGAGAQTLTPSLYSNAQSFFAPTVSVGAVSLAPSLFTDGQTFYAPTVSQGVQVLTPALLTNSSSFYVPVVSVGAVALSPSLLTNTQTFYGPTVTQAGQALSPSLYSNSQSFYAPTVTVGAVDLTPELFTSTSSFFVPYVSDGTAAGFVRYFDVLSGRLLILKPLGAVAAASGATWTEVEVDFGSSPVYGSEFTITDAAITAASKVQVMPCGKAATGRTADDWAWDGAAFAANPGAGSATCYAQFLPGPIVGKRKVQYSVGA